MYVHDETSCALSPIRRLHRASIDGVFRTKDASVSFIAPAGSHAVNTNCSAAHSRQALSCKMAVEYDKFIESGKKSESLFVLTIFTDFCY